MIAVCGRQAALRHFVGDNLRLLLDTLEGSRGLRASFYYFGIFYLC